MHFTLTSILLKVIALATFTWATSINQKVCSTKACEDEAEKMLSKIDDSIELCDDFFGFACGRYKPEIPDEKTKIDELHLMQDSLQMRLNEIMNGSIIAGDIEPFKKAKMFYQNCVDKDMIEKLQLKPIKALQKQMGGWPVIDKDWNEDSWSWQKMVKDLEKIGFPANFVFELTLGSDVKNTSKRTLGIDQPQLGLYREYLIKGLDDKLVQAYHSYQVDTAVIYGANRSQAELEMRDALDFEIALAQISLAREDRRNSTKLYNPMTVKTLQQKCPDLDWVEYFNTFLSDANHIDENEIIILINKTYPTKICELLKSTSKRTIANYMMWRASLSVASYLDETIRSRTLDFVKIQSGKTAYEPRWKECVAMTASFMPIATGALYVREYFREASKAAATEMVDRIKNEFRTILKTVSWMDEDTRAAALSKVDKMQNHIGYPSELMDDRKLTEFYNDVEVDENGYMKSVLNFNRFRIVSEMKKLREPVNKTNWETHSEVAVANAYYSWLENSILIPAGILQGQFFSADRPRYMNYASIGYVIGHEITHGFDDQGRQFDSEGNLVDWWKEDTKTAYLEKARCIIEQYGNYTETSVGLKLNGINTQGENIADNGGLIIAYRAYQLWVKDNGPELPFPVLNYSPNQLFWLSVAQTWCSAYRLEEIRQRITTGVHSLARFRIIGPFSNLKEFSNDFHCPQGSGMNPAKKCKVW